MQFITKKAIAAGEELLVSYGAMAQPRKQRRERLLGQYGFWCVCPRCEPTSKAKTE